MWVQGHGFYNIKEGRGGGEGVKDLASIICVLIEKSF